MTSSSEPSHLRRSARHIIAGGSAGFVEVCCMQPIDVVKTRFQIQGVTSDPSRYTSILDCITRMIRNEGFFSLYKGILPPVVADTPKRAAKFLVFESSKSACASVNFTGPWSLVTAGLASGTVEGAIIAPFERVKVYIQVQRQRMSEMPNTWLVAREIIKRDGWGTRGLTKGFHATVLRNAMFNAVYFGSYYNMKYLLIPPEKQDSIPLRLCLGFTAGALSSLGNLPVDVAKSRIQASQSPKYTRTFPTILTVWREEGWCNYVVGV
ncbi:Mitochondrial 2-oxodicarboxylate carrier [Geodia barretti]|uniref:Mitochondrial 2-oxodicarboxylate carrier n=1 Tax=Geodia barretti TaxID=519541 RepID=A0AA35TCC6_GEOBA|nr:Mitochondrial 2-oxodicarboxylate carrier [Geodia barretti]